MSSRPHSSSQASVRGPTLRDIHAQQQADQDFEALMRSEEPGAPVKAFARGLLAGSLVPTVTGLVPWAAGGVQREVVGVKQRAHLAHLLQSKGLSPEAAHNAAAGTLKFLQDVDDTPQVGKALVSEMTSGVAFPQGLRIPVPEWRGKVWPSREAALAEVGMNQRMVDAMVPVSGGNFGARARPTSAQASNVLEEAENAFLRAARANPDIFKQMPPTAQVIGRSLKNELGGVARMTIPLGVLAGIGAAARVRGQRRKVRDLRDQQKVAEDQSVVERGLQAAPAVAAVPGFALGAADPGAFNPEGLLGSGARRVLGPATGARSRFVSGLAGAGAFATAAGLPSAMYSGYKAMVGSRPADVSTTPTIIQKQASASLLREIHRIRSPR